MNPADLDAALDRALRELPQPQAPPTFLPRVMAAVQMRSRQPWYTRVWVTWPAGWQVVSVALLVLLVAAGALLTPPATASLVGAARPWVSGLSSELASVVRRVDVAAAAFRVISRTVLEPVAPYVFVVAALMWIACVALGAALTRVVPREVFQR